MDRKQLAHDYFKQGYNCAQAMVLAFEDILPLNFEMLENLSSAFGGGFAKTRNLCGAVSGIGIVIGLISEHLEDVEADKKDIYQKVRSVSDKFLQENGTLICGELLKDLPNITSNYIPSERTAEYYATRPCVKFVMDAVGFVETYIKEQNLLK